MTHDHAHATQTGLAPVRDINWGDHFCHLYRTGDDLAETLVPYFKRGLEQNEACLWVASDPYPAERAVAELKAAVPDLDERAAKGQFAIFRHDEWYTRSASLSPKEVLQGWLERTHQAVSAGFQGLRISGNTAWLSADVWEDFMDYERAVTEAFRHQRIIAMCSYSLQTCNAEAVLDIVHHHDFALARRRGQWEMVENAGTKHAKAELSRLNADLENRIQRRTADLQASVAHQRLLLDELNHRVKNSLASVQTIVAQTLAKTPDPEQARANINGRIAALARVHGLLTVDRWQGAALSSLIGSELASYGDRYSLEGDALVLRPRAALAVGMILHELATNAAKHGALGAGGGRVKIEGRLRGGRVDIAWNEVGGPPVQQPSRNGFGTALVKLLGQHDLGGAVILRFDPRGLNASISIPAAGQIDRVTQ